jgi:hypothetical protein
MQRDGDGDEVLAAILASAKTIRPEDVRAEMEAAMSDPLLLEIVDRAVAPHEGKLTPDQLAQARDLLLAYFVTDPRAQRLMDELRSAGGKSHVVATREASDPEVAKPRAARGPRRR